MYHYAGNNPVRFVDPDGNDYIHFFYTYNEISEKEQSWRNQEEFFIQDDILYLAMHGIKLIPRNGTKDVIIKALQDDDAVLIVFSGHGSSTGGICTADGNFITPEEVAKLKIGKNLQTVIFENCHQGTESIKKRWEKAFGDKVTVVGWKGTTYKEETISFNSIGLFDRQKKRLFDYVKEAEEKIKSLRQEYQNRIRQFNISNSAYAGDKV